MGVGSEGVAEFLDAAPVIDDDTRPPAHLLQPAG